MNDGRGLEPPQGDTMNETPHERAMAEGVRRATAGEPVPDPAAGWERLDAAITAQAGAVEARRRPANDNRIARWRAIAAVLAAVAIGQTAWIVAQPDDRARLASVESVASTDYAELTLAFRPDATEGDLRALLGETGASLVSGPSALGLYRVRVPADRLAAADETFGQSDLVESVTRP